MALPLDSSCIPQDSIPQVIPEIQNGFHSFLTGKTGQRVQEESSGNAILVVLIHHITAGSQVVVDEHRQAAASSINIQPPVSLRVSGFYRLGSTRCTNSGTGIL